MNNDYTVVTWGTPVQTMEYDLINTLNSKMKQLEVSVKQLRNPARIMPMQNAHIRCFLHKSVCD